MSSLLLRLQSAAMAGDVERIGLELAAGADVNGQNPSGLAALHWAAVRGHVDAVRFLLSQGADPNLPDSLGERPLQFICRSVSYADSDEVAPAIARLLVEAGADIHAKDSAGATPLRDKLPGTQRLRDAEMAVAMLKAAGESLEGRYYGRSLLQWFSSSAVAKDFIRAEQATARAEARSGLVSEEIEAAMTGGDQRPRKRLSL